MGVCLVAPVLASCHDSLLVLHSHCELQSTVMGQALLQNQTEVEHQFDLVSAARFASETCY